MLQAKFIQRQIRRSSRQASIFCLCVCLSVMTLTAYSGFSKSVNRALLKDARELHAADIIIRSNRPLSNMLMKALSAEVDQGRVEHSPYHEFYSVVRTAGGRNSLLSLLKIVAPGYPFYGRVVLGSGRPLGQVLKKGRVVAEQSLLDRLQVNIGDRLHIGHTTLVITDVVLHEPDRPLSLFSFGPRIFVSHQDLQALGLLQTGSRVRYVSLVKVHETGMLEAVTGRLAKAAVGEGERVETFRTARSRVKIFFDNFIFFLKLIGIFTLMVAGVGIQGTLAALLDEKRYTIAIMKTLGATSRYVTRHFMLLVFILGLAGAAMGIPAGLLVQRGLAYLLSAFFPPNMQPTIAWTGVLESLILGLAVTAMFSFLPLHRLKDMRPVTIFRNEIPQPSGKWPVYLSGAGFILFFLGLVAWHMRDIRFGFYFLAATLALILLASMAARLLLKVMRRLRIRRLSVRQAVKGLFRKGNATHATMVTLTASLSVIFAIFLVEQNLDAAFIKSYPADAPNLFALDIQPSQVESFSKTIQGDFTFFPVIRARVTAVNGRTIDHAAERRKRRDNLGRVFNLTYRGTLLHDERIIKGAGLFRRDWTSHQVSILDDVVEMHPLDIGDTIRFNIQGVPLDAKVASIRTRTKASLSPFFYFVFQKETLQTAPHTLFTALRVPRHRVAPLQNKIVNTFPNIGVIDLSETIRVFAGLMKRLSAIVRSFSALSMAAGILILVSAVYATRNERTTESVYYKILGAKRSFVFRVFSLELILTGLLSGFLATVMAQTGAFLICRFYLHISYGAFLAPLSLMTAATLGVILAAGLFSAKSIMDKKPTIFLREKTDE